MSKSKKNISDELLDLKLNESSDVSINSKDLDIDFSDLDDAEETAVKEEIISTRTSVAPGAKDNTIRLIEHAEVKNDNAVEKVSYGLPAKQQVPKSSDGSAFISDPQLKHSEHLRIAQRKINELEEEISKMRKENEELGLAGETFKKLNDEYFASIENFKSKVVDQKQTFSQEIELLKKINHGKDKQINEFKQQIEDYKSRFDNNFQRVRKREKDLEHRLEIAKIEEAAVVKSKDQLILDLKRRIDELLSESENFRKKSQENYKELQKKQQVVRGVIRALRMALTKLEGDDDSDFGLDVAQSGVEDEE